MPQPIVLDRLDDQVALVTGANRGIGKAIADGLHELGATVYAAARAPDQVVRRDRMRPVALDVTDDGSIDDAVRHITAEAGHLDILVNNAGIAEGWGARLDNVPVDLFDDVIRTNLRGPVVLTKACLPLLLAQAGSRVVNVSSGMGAMGEGMSGGNPGYRISKSGLNSFTVYLDSDYRDKGLIANVLCPGWVHTDMGGTNAPLAPEEGADTALWLARFAPGSPGGKWYRRRTPIDW